MRKVLLLALMALVALAGWRVMGRLSSDAVGMALGLLFGVVAGVPAAGLVLLSARRRPDSAPEEAAFGARGGPGGSYAVPQPSVIVLAAPGYDSAQQYSAARPYGWSPSSALPGPTIEGGQRSFRIVGEVDESIGEW